MASTQILELHHAPREIEQVVVLYDHAIRFMESGRFGIEHGDASMASEYLQKARRIVLELTACIDIDRGGEIAKNMLSLYSYLLNELMEAAIGGKLESVDRSIRILTNLRSTWASTPSDGAIETVLPQAA